MKVYSVDVKIWATAYIKADSPEQAHEKLQSLRHETLEVDGDPLISGKRFDDEDLPEISLSPAMTIDGDEINNIQIDDLDLAD